MPPAIIAVRHDPAAAVERIVSALLAQEVVLLPTDTVYGLVALPGRAETTAQIFALKGRAASTPLAVLCGDTQQAAELADPSAGAALSAVGARWWPGPLTVVAPRRPGTGLHLGEPADTIGLRVPDDDLLAAVVAAVGPVAATSANRHGRPTPATARAAAASLTSDISLVVDGGRLPGRASTVVDATTEPWTVLREGPIAGRTVLSVATEAIEGR